MGGAGRGRKRLKRSALPAKDDVSTTDSRKSLNNESIRSDRDNEVPVDNLDRYLAESSVLASRCSVRLIHQVVSQFDKKKRDLVKSAGFGGLLCFPPMKQINRKFALWIMSCVDEDNAEIVVGGHTRIKFTKEDVATVFGIPCFGKRVMVDDTHSRQSKDRVIKEYLGNGFKENRSIKLIQEILERSYGYPMRKEEEDAFMVAFVVFVVSTLLSPSAKHDYACVDYWSAIEDASAISSYDWSDFVMVRLLDAAAKLKKDVSGSMKCPNITGGSLFVQVLYLDSIRLGALSLPHNCFPRIRVFCNDTIRDMIAADKNFLRYEVGTDDSCNCKLRDAGECSYQWARMAQSNIDCSNGGYFVAIWQTALLMARFLKLPMEVIWIWLLFVGLVSGTCRFQSVIVAPSFVMIKNIVVRMFPIGMMKLVHQDFSVLPLCLLPCKQNSMCFNKPASMKPIKGHFTLRFYNLGIGIIILMCILV